MFTYFRILYQKNLKLLQKLMLLLLLIALTLIACGCTPQLKAPETDIFDLTYELSEKEELEPVYVSDTKVYAAVNRETVTEAPIFGAVTERFIVYNLLTEKVEAQLELDEDGAYICHGVPFEDGILYAVCTALSDDTAEWSVKYISENESKVMDSGRCSNMYFASGFALLDGNVYYLYEEYDEQTGYGFGIKKAVLGNPETIVEEKSQRLIDTEFYNNGTDFALLIAGKAADGKDDVLIGNANGIYQGYDFPEQLESMGICKDYLFCCTTSDGNRWTARSISLKTGEEYTAESKIPLYRISSMQGSELTCVDMDFNMYLFRPGKKFEIVPVENTKDIQLKRTTVRYNPYAETKTLAQLNRATFCRITW